MTRLEKWSIGNCARNWNSTIWIYNVWDSKIQKYHLIATRRPDLVIVTPPPPKKKWKKRKCRMMEFAVVTDHKVRVKENEKRDKYLVVARELEKTMGDEGDSETNCNWCTWNDSQRLAKGLQELEISGRAKTIQTTALLWLARILRRVLNSWGDLVSLRLYWKTISKGWCKKFARNNSSNGPDIVVKDSKKK